MEKKKAKKKTEQQNKPCVLLVDISNYFFPLVLMMVLETSSDLGLDFRRIFGI